MVNVASLGGQYAPVCSFLCNGRSRGDDTVLPGQDGGLVVSSPCVLSRSLSSSPSNSRSCSSVITGRSPGEDRYYPCGFFAMSFSWRKLIDGAENVLRIDSAVPRQCYLIKLDGMPFADSLLSFFSSSSPPWFNFLLRFRSLSFFLGIFKKMLRSCFLFNGWIVLWD